MHKKSPDIKIGDLVYVVDTALPRNNWLKGRIEKLFPVKDGPVREVDVKTTKEIYKRTVTKLCRILLSDTPTLCYLEEYVGDTTEASQ